MSQPTNSQLANYFGQEASTLTTQMFEREKELDRLTEELDSLKKKRNEVFDLWRKTCEHVWGDPLPSNDNDPRNEQRCVICGECRKIEPCDHVWSGPLPATEQDTPQRCSKCGECRRYISIRLQ